MTPPHSDTPEPFTPDDQRFALALFPEYVKLALRQLSNRWTLLLKFSPYQERDESGRWIGGETNNAQIAPLGSTLGGPPPPPPPPPGTPENNALRNQAQQRISTFFHHLEALRTGSARTQWYHPNPATRYQRRMEHRNYWTAVIANFMIYNLPNPFAGVPRPEWMPDPLTNAVNGQNAVAQIRQSMNDLSALGMSEAQIQAHLIAQLGPPPTPPFVGPVGDMPGP